MTTTELQQRIPKHFDVAQKLNEKVHSVIGSHTLAGFEKAYLVANAVGEIANLLTAEYMKPIMALQGNKLGFRTDKDRNGGYPEAVVKNCLIEAVLMGLQPTGNQFNIIAGNTYPTKEGLGYLLNNFTGLDYELVCGLPKINSEKTGAAVDVNIRWTLNGITKEKNIPIPIKMDAYTTVDAIIGKATRKGRAWLLSTITGIEIVDGDVTEDIEGKIVSSSTPEKGEIDLMEQAIIDGLEFYQGTDKEKIKAECVAAKKAGKFTVEFAQGIAKKINIDL
jgi:hypothetical protein